MLWLNRNIITFIACVFVVGLLAGCGGGGGMRSMGNGDTMTGNGDAMTGNGDAMTGNGDAMTGNGDAMTGNGNTMTGNGNTMTGNGDAMTGNGDAMTGNGDAMTGNGDAMTTDPLTHPLTLEDVTLQGIHSLTSQILENATSWLTSDIVGRQSGAIPPHRWEASCAQSSCTITAEDLDIPTSVDDLRDEYSNDPLLSSVVVFTERRGVILGEYSTRTEIEGTTASTSSTSLGGWMEHNFLGGGLTQFRGGEIDGGWSASTSSVGNAPGTNPVLSGNATWIGALFGIDTSSLSPHIRGDATLTLDVAQMEMDVAFTNISNVDTSQSRTDMTWSGLSVTDGRFGTGNAANSIDGQFYGPNHEEVGGVFERDQIIGAFGARR